MKLKFFVAKMPGAAPAPPKVSIRATGGISLNASAMTAISAEHGEAATVCFEEESQQWLLAHWPNGEANQPMLRALTGKKSKGLRFQTIAAAQALYAVLPKALRSAVSVSCLLAPEPLTSPDAPGASFYVLTLPNENTEQPGVARGTTRQAQATTKKGAGRG